MLLIAVKIGNTNLLPPAAFNEFDYGPSINFKFKSESFSGAVTSLITYMLVYINVHSLSNNFDEFTLI